MAERNDPAEPGGPAEPTFADRARQAETSALKGLLNRLRHRGALVAPRPAEPSADQAVDAEARAADAEAQAVAGQLDSTLPLGEPPAEADGASRGAEGRAVDDILSEPLPPHPPERSA
ncbi:MAG: hypothetical protein ACYDAG_03135 [Chloroflexota bacterium]